MESHFKPEEFRCKCCGRLPDKGMAASLLSGLETLRRMCGDKPIQVLSGYRCPKHNKEVGGVDNSYHTQGKAADLVIPKGMGLEGFAAKAKEAGFKRMGLYHKQRFLHVDVGESPSPARWNG